MTFPTYDPQVGVSLTPDGRNIEMYWPKDGNAWTAAVVKARLWLIKEQWKYDLREGIDLLNKVLGQVAEIRIIQELFRKEISREVDLSLLKMRNGEKGEVLIEWKGKSKITGEEQGGTISIIEPPVESEIVFLRYKFNTSTMLAMIFSHDLYAEIPPKPADFELLRESSAPPELIALSIKGTHLFLVFSGDVDGCTITYLPSNKPMRGTNQTLVKPFRFVATA